MDELLKIYEVCWIPIGIKIRKQREGYFKKGRKFYAPFINRTLANDRAGGLRELFKIRIGKYILSGRIDRVDQLRTASWKLLIIKPAGPRKK